MLYGHQNLPFKSVDDRLMANHQIDEFIGIIEQEKMKSEKFAKRIEEVDFKVLLARPPRDKTRQHVPSLSNFEESEDPDRELWAQWEKRYSFKDKNMDLVDEAIMAKSHKYYKQINSGIIGYTLLHLTSKIGLK